MDMKERSNHYMGKRGVVLAFSRVGKKASRNISQLLTICKAFK
jgi:hypothetical protein